MIIWSRVRNFQKFSYNPPSKVIIFNYLLWNIIFFFGISITCLHLTYGYAWHDLLYDWKCENAYIYKCYMNINCCMFKLLVDIYIILVHGESNSPMYMCIYIYSYMHVYIYIVSHLISGNICQCPAGLLPPRPEHGIDFSCWLHSRAAVVMLFVQCIILNVIL